MTATKFPYVLPPDSRGVPSGPKYQPFLHAGRGHNKSTGYNTSFVPKFGRALDCLSTIERNLALSILLNPKLLDFREQYPECDLCRVKELLEAGEKIPKNAMPTLDGVATFGKLDADAEFSYIGFSVKPSRDLINKAAVRTLLRDKLFCEELGWGWQLVTERDIDHLAVKNATLVLSFANEHKESPDDAERLGIDLLTARPAKNLDSTLRLAAKRTEIDPNKVYALFAHVVLIGTLQLDHRYPLALRKPLKLKNKGPALGTEALKSHKAKDGT